jgi:hypothetical protein
MEATRTRGPAARFDDDTKFATVIRKRQRAAGVSSDSNSAKKAGADKYKAALREVKEATSLLQCAEADLYTLQNSALSQRSASKAEKRSMRCVVGLPPVCMLTIVI